MQLLDPDTIWVFISGSDEERFLNDISFGIHCLLYRQFPVNNILLFIDQPSLASFVSTYDFPSGVNYYYTNEIEQELSARNPKKLVIIVTGHGSSEGIAATPNINPCQLINLFKGLSELKFALIVLGQCYAGTFNYLEARSKDSQTGKVIPPEICIIGATNLTMSLSIPINFSNEDPFKDFSCLLEWNANLFLLYFVALVAVPRDVDGDGHFTVLDAYKAATIYTNQDLMAIKQNAFMIIYQSIVTGTISQLTASSTISQQLAVKGQQDLINACQTILINQDSWVLNAHLARKLLLL